MNFQLQVRKGNKARLRYGNFILFVDKVYLNSGVQFFRSLRLEGFRNPLIKYASISTLVVIAHSCDH